MLGLKKFFLRKRNKDIFTKKDVTESTEIIDYQNAQDIGILIDGRDIKSMESVQSFVKKLQKDGKKVSVLTYMHRKTKLPFTFKFNFFRYRDISITGYIKSKAVNEFINKSFDYLYCINIKPTIIFENILLQSKAKCRIGKFFSYRKKYTELLIDLKEKEQENTLVEHMLLYTRSVLT